MERVLLLLLLGVLGGSAQTFTCDASNDATVCGALGDLYYATNGASWSFRAGWINASVGTPTDYCSTTFYGATCIGGVLKQLCVRRIWRSSRAVLRRPTCALSNLNNNQLSGTIPSSLSDLTGLQNLCVRRAAG